MAQWLGMFATWHEDLLAGDTKFSSLEATLENIARQDYTRGTLVTGAHWC